MTPITEPHSPARQRAQPETPAAGGHRTVRRFVPADEPQVLELLRAAFGVWPHGLEDVASEDFFRWKMFASPFGEAMLFVAQQEARIIGFQARLPWHLRAGERIFRTMRGVDLAVHPAHQRRGVSMELRRLIMASMPADLDFSWGNPNASSRPGSIKLGRQLAGYQLHFMRPCRSASGWMRRGLRRGASSLERSPVDAPAAAAVLGDGDLVTRVLAAQPQPGLRFTTAKDLTYLRWRYGHFPHYRAISIEGDTAGIAIFRYRRRGSLWVSDICELLVERGDRRTTRELLARVAGAADADLLCCCFRSRAHAATHGFFEAPSRTVLTVSRLERELQPDPGRRASWALVRGDLELL
jgi:GNAT superfamily N-acetyltransferase